MRRIGRPSWRILVGAALLFGALAGRNAPACEVPPDYLTWNGRLARTAAKLKNRAPTTIVALGAAFTAGSFPDELQAELLHRFPGTRIELRSRGNPGDRPADMLMRLDRDVLAQHPDLVIWEPGIYNVGGSGAVGALRTVLRDGIVRLRFIGVDVILIEPAHAPDFTEHAAHVAYVETLRDLALERGIPLYRRFDTTRHWAGSSVSESRCVARHVAALIAARVANDSWTRQK